MTPERGPTIDPQLDAAGPDHLYRDWTAEGFQQAIYRVDPSCVRSAPVDHNLPRQAV